MTKSMCLCLCVCVCQRLWSRGGQSTWGSAHIAEWHSFTSPAVLCKRLSSPVFSQEGGWGTPDNPSPNTLPSDHKLPRPPLLSRQTVQATADRP